MIVKKATLSVFYAVFFLSLIGCSVHQSDVGNPIDAPEKFSDSGTGTVPDRWWQTFGDTELNTLVKKGLNRNFNLKTAWNRMKAANAVVERTSADLYPELTGNARGDISRTDAGDVFTTADEELSLGVSADYEVDLWGRIESSVKAEEFRFKASREDYQSAALSLSAELARTWYRLTQQRNQLRILNEQIQTNREVYKLIKSQFGSGQIRSADLLRQEQLLESTREQKISVESQIQTLKHQLAVLLGRSPQKSLDFKPDTLPELPPLPETGLPTTLVQRRPDVRSAYNQLRAADRDLAVAISEQYPRLTFTASLSTFDDDDSPKLFRDWARSFAGDLTAPLLDAGRRDAEVDRTRAVRNQRLYEYGQSILTAFRDVENALVREQKQLQRVKSLRDQLNLADKTVERLRSQYLNGSANYIDVLEALSEQQQLRRDLLEARFVVIDERIALYRALAGGFKTNMTEEFAMNEKNN